MSLCTKIISNKPATCNPVSGGIAAMFLFDPAVVGFAVYVDNPDIGYVTLDQLNDDPAELYPVRFQRYEAEYTSKQSSKAGFYTKYEHQIMCVSPDLSQLQTQWNMLVDRAGLCCGIGIIMVLNDGRILIMGEQFRFEISESTTNIVQIGSPLATYQDGSTASSGKKFDDANATTIMIKGDWMQPLVELIGGVSQLFPFIVH